MWNPWKHVRLAGAVIVIVAAFINNLPLTIIGLFIQYLGVVGGIDRVERLIEKIIPTENDNASN